MAQVLGQHVRRLIRTAQIDEPETDALDTVEFEVVEPLLGAHRDCRVALIGVAVPEPRPDVKSGVGDITLHDPCVHAVRGQPRRDACPPVLALDMNP